MKKNLMFTTAALFALIGLLIYDPAKYMQSVRAGLELFSFNVLPSLFPFFFLTRLLTLSGGATSISKIFERPLKKFFKLPSQAGTIFMLSALSGYPVGAKLISDYYGRGEITSSDARKMSALCSTSGPFFVIGTVGASILLSPVSGYIIFVCHILAAIFSGLIICNFTQSENSSLKIILPQKTTLHSENIFSDSVCDSVVSVALVGGYITLFYMFADMLILSGLLYPVIFTLSALLNALNLTPAFSEGMISGLIEVTRGCFDLAKVSTGKLSVMLCCGLISFGGFSVNLQAMAFLSKCKIKVRTYFLYKLVHMIFALALCGLAVNLMM